MNSLSVLNFLGSSLRGFAVLVKHQKNIFLIEFGLDVSEIPTRIICQYTKIMLSGLPYSTKIIPVFASYNVSRTLFMHWVQND